MWGAAMTWKESLRKIQDRQNTIDYRRPMQDSAAEVPSLSGMYVVHEVVDRADVSILVPVSALVLHRGLAQPYSMLL